MLRLSLAVLAGCVVGGCSAPTTDAAQRNAPRAANVTLTDPQRARIQVQKVSASDYRRSLETTGVVDYDGDQATSVVAPFSGLVSKLLADKGQQVDKGQPLARVDSSDFAGAISTYRKALADARTARRLADRDQKLFARGVISRNDEERVQADAGNAEADRDAALQGLLALNVDAQIIEAIRQGKATPHVQGVIRAPISGTVVDRTITPGQLLQAGATPCFVVADLSRVWVDAQVFGRDMNAVQVGDHAEVLMDESSKPLPGKVTNVSASVDPDTRSVIARTLLDNPGGVLKQKMYVQVRIESARIMHGTLVPVAAVLHDDNNLPFVYVEKPDGSFARQHVTLGDRVDDRYVISVGLHAGEQIIVDGGIFVRFMQSQ